MDKEKMAAMLKAAGIDVELLGSNPEQAIKDFEERAIDGNDNEETVIDEAGAFSGEHRNTPPARKMQEEVLGMLRSVSEATKGMKDDRASRFIKDFMETTINPKLLPLQKDLDKYKAATTIIEKKLKEFEMYKSSGASTKKIQDRKAALREWMSGSTNEKIELHPQANERKSQLMEYPYYDGGKQKSITTNYAVDLESQGGLFVLPYLSARIQKEILETSDVMRYSRVERITGTDIWQEIFEKGFFSAEPRLERQDVIPTDSPDFAMIEASVKELQMLIAITNKMLKFKPDLESWAVTRMVEFFKKYWGYYFIHGDGSTYPAGFMSSYGRGSEVTVFGSGAAGALFDEYFELMDLIALIKEGYSPAFYGNRNTWYTTFRKYVDGNSRPYIQGSDGMRIEGYDYRIMQDMDSIGSGTYPLMFGDLQAAYVIFISDWTEFIRENVTKKGWTKIWKNENMGAIIVQPEAMYKVQCNPVFGPLDPGDII